MDVLQQANQMVVALARLLRDGETVFHGVASPIPLTAIQLAKALYAPNLIYLNITGGIDVQAPKIYPSTAHPGLTQGTAALFSLTEIFDLSARGGLDTAFLSGVQIDGRGDINMSVIGDFAKPKVRLPGGAGSAVIMPTAKRTLIWRTKHDKKIFVENLSFKTAAGRVDKVVTPLCVFTKEEGRLKVWRIHPGVSWEELQENTGFPLEKSAGFAVTEEPTGEELALLEKIDAERGRTVEF